MNALTRTLLGYPNSWTYPSVNWFKGDDTRTLCSFLVSKFAVLVDQPENGHISYVASIHQALVAANLFLSTLYRSGLWLTERQRRRIIDSVGSLLEHFTQCANYAFTQGWVRFKFQPKFHMIAELRYGLMMDAKENRASISPLAFSCQMDEDFVGRIATQSRRVSARTLHVKVLQRYKISLAAGGGKNAFKSWRLLECGDF
eukprot:Skav200056  [mRNA]  locus=scaffold2277:17789:18391:- [translate_table: standard]